MASNERYDLVVSSENEKGFKSNTKVGAIFVNEKDGKRYLSIQLNPGIALSQPNGVRINGFVPLPKDGQRGAAKTADDASGFGGSDDGF